MKKALRKWIRCAVEGDDIVIRVSTPSLGVMAKYQYEQSSGPDVLGVGIVDDKKEQFAREFISIITNENRDGDSLLIEMIERGIAKNIGSTTVDFMKKRPAQINERDCRICGRVESNHAGWQGRGGWTHDPEWITK